MGQLNSILAIDGGGTRCPVALAVGTERHQGATDRSDAPINLSGCASEIRKGLSQIAKQAGLGTADLNKVPACLCIAGVVGSKIGEVLAQRLPLTEVRLEDDRRSAERHALGDCDGVHCATEACQAIQAVGKIRLIRERSPQLGGESSLQWLGRQAPSATLSAFDHSGDKSDLSNAILTKIGSALAIISDVAQATAYQIGKLAKLVSLSSETAPLTLDLVTYGTTKLVGPLKPFGRKHESTLCLPLCLKGNFGPGCRDVLPNELPHSLGSAHADPIDSAIVITRDFLEEIAR